MIAIIPGLCPFDDFLMWLLFPIVTTWIWKKFKWCKKNCACKCHEHKKDEFKEKE